jgi:L-fucose isomerase-like protein
LEETAKLRAQLEASDLELIGPGEPVSDLSAAEIAADDLAAQPVDLLLIFQATFADSTMVTALAEAVDAPIFLWAVPEPRTGGRLRLNSLCGINLAGHALRLRGTAYKYAYAQTDDMDTIAQVKAIATAGRVRRRLANGRLGVVGEHPDGLDTCHLDPLLLKDRLGTEVVSIDLPTVFTRAQGIETEKLDSARSRLDQKLDNLASLEQEPLRGTLGVYSALKEIAAAENLDGLAVRCWPEFFTELGCAACGAMSMLSDEKIPCSCEADVNGTITQLILQWLSDEPAFGSDFVSVDYDEDVGVLWHCGLAPLSMADPDVQPRGGIHSNRQLPLVMEFTLKPGTVTIARLSRATGELRVVLGRGEMISGPPSFSGTSGLIRFERPVRKVLDVILGEGLEHHLSMTYGDHLSSLLALAELLDLPVLRL